MSRAIANTITVTGVGDSNVVPDLLRIQVSISVNEPSAVAALSRNAEVSSRCLAALTTLGIPERKISTTGASLTPQTQWRENEGTIVTGYTSSQTLSFTTELSAQNVLSELFDAGGDDVRLDSLNYISSNPAPAHSQAQQAAWLSALAQAENLAALAGRKLGPLLTIDDVSEQGHGGIRPLALTAVNGSGGGNTPSFSPGEVATSIRLRVSFALNDPSEVG